jgi:hypothetical protein
MRVTGWEGQPMLIQIFKKKNQCNLILTKKYQQVLTYVLSLVNLLTGQLKFLIGSGRKVCE